MRGLRIRDPSDLSINEQRALVGLNDAGENLHERRLAGAVFADQRVNRPGLDAEADIRERVNAPVGLCDPLQFQEWRGLGAHRGYAAGTPPSTLMMFPVDFADRGPAKKAIASATSSG